MATLASKEEVTVSEDLRRLQIHFYPLPPKSAPDAKASQETPRRATASQFDHPTQALTTTPMDGPISLDVAFSGTEDDMQDRLSALAEEHRMSLEDQLVAFNKLRLIVMMDDRGKRCKMLTVRLLAMATYGE